MDNDTTAVKMCEHLRFLGYEIGDPWVLESGSKAYIAKHEKHLNYLMFSLDKNMTIVRTQLSTQRTASPAGDACINTLNKSAILSKIYYEPDDETGHVVIKFEAIYTGDYERERFSAFIDFLRDEHQALLSNECMGECFRGN